MCRLPHAYGLFHPSFRPSVQPQQKEKENTAGVSVPDIKVQNVHKKVLFVLTMDNMFPLPPHYAAGSGSALSN